MTRFWTSIVFRLTIASDDFRVFLAPNATAVQDLAYHWHNWIPFGWKSKDIRVSPFAKSCLGVDTLEAYEVSLNIYRINYWQVSAHFDG